MSTAQTEAVLKEAFGRFMNEAIAAAPDNHLIDFGNSRLLVDQVKSLADAIRHTSEAALLQIRDPNSPAAKRISDCLAGLPGLVQSCHVDGLSQMQAALQAAVASAIASGEATGARQETPREQEIKRLWGDIEKQNKTIAEQMREAHDRHDITDKQYEDWQRQQALADRYAASNDSRRLAAQEAANNTAGTHLRSVEDKQLARGDTAGAARTQTGVAATTIVSRDAGDVGDLTSFGHDQRLARSPVSASTPVPNNQQGVHVDNGQTVTPTPQVIAAAGPSVTTHRG